MYAGLGGQVDLQGRRNRGPSSNMADSSGCSEKSRICGHCREIGPKACCKSFTLSVTVANTADDIVTFTDNVFYCESDDAFHFE